MTSMTDVLIARGEEAVKSLADGTGQAVRDNLFEAGRGLMAARQKIPVDQDFGTWLHSSVYSFLNADEQAALIKLGEYEAEVRPLMQGSTLTSAAVIWQQFKDAAEAIRFRSVAKSAADVRVSEEVSGSDTEAGGSSEVVVHENDESGALGSWKPPKSRPKNQTKLTKALGDNTDYLYGWFSANAIRQTLSPLTSERRGRPMLKTIAATVLDGSCRHARTADLRKFDARIAFPHLPEKFARGAFMGVREEKSGRPEGFPFDVTLVRSLHWSDSGVHDGVLLLVRIAPEDIEPRRRERIQTAIDRKRPKLTYRKAEGARTVLALENNDMILTNHALVGEHVAELLPERSEWLDELFFMYTTTSTWTLYRWCWDDAWWEDGHMDFDAAALLDVRAE